MVNHIIKLSIRTKLFFLVLVAFTVLIITTSWRIGVQADKVASTAIDRSLQQSSTVLNTKIASRLTSIKEVATGIAKDGRVLPLVFDRESETLQDLSHEFKRVLEFDVLFFTDADGVILARSDRPEAIGRSMAGNSALFDKALIGEESRGVIVSRGKFLQMVVVPIFDNVAADLVRGTVALAYEFSNEIAEEIHALTASDIGFFVFTRDSNRSINGVSSTYNTNDALKNKLDRFFSENIQEWKHIYNTESVKTRMHLSLDNEDFYSVVHALSNEPGNPLGFIMALRSRTELLKPFLDIQRTVFVIGFACLVVASIFAWFFALRISRPIIKLVSITKSIQEGNYPDIETRSTSGDEVGALYDAVVKMGNTLKEKAELENYLAQMSDELDIEESIPLLVEEGTLESDQFEQKPATQPTSPKNASEEATRISVNRKIEDTSEMRTDRIVDRRYKIIRLIGAGAMGRVYLAQDLDLDENVAIKIMKKEFFTLQESVDFKEEIRLARKITHRNILRTFDYGSWQDFYYITMEYVSGFDLGQLLETKGAFDTNVGIIMARQICSAMNAAHEQGIIHRDLKPSNMMINRQGILKIMDFGLAMKVNKEISKTKRHNNKSKTTIAGTPRYMAPEQFYNWQLDQRTDIYAIGAILYTLFNGAPPFTCGEFEKLARLHLNAPVPDISGKNGQFPIELQNIIQTALAKQPDDRYQSVRDILDDLNVVLD